MADWKKIGSRGNVEDRRSLSPAAIGGISVTGIVLLLAVNFLNTGSIEDALKQTGGQVLQQQLEQQQNPQPNTNTQQFAGQDDYEVFASTILGSNNDAWRTIFAQQARGYEEPKLVLFRQATESACGGATSAVGPHYCPTDQTIYLDETFFDEMTREFGAKGGDVAQAYVISHEVGHHIQNSLGTLDQASQDNETSVKIELQADCYAGIWASTIKDKGILEPNEIEEAMDAASSIGDDRIQEKAQGYINPESFTHGSSAERVKWFTTGYDQGTIEACNTFQ